MFGIVMRYSLSSGRSRNVTWLDPSMSVAAELPRNLDFGRRSPQMSSMFSGDVKYLSRRESELVRAAQDNRKTNQAEMGGWCETCSAT